jgi:hypothetical protein
MGKTVRGTCRLCLVERELVLSHYMPAAMYAYIKRGSIATHDHPIVMGKRLTSMTSLQVKDYLLCAECEDLFNKNGETYTLGWMWNGKDFPLYDRLQLALPGRQSDKYASFSGPAIGVDTEKLAYFALSLVWRGAVHTWNEAFGEKSTRVNLGSFEEPIRQYLHSDAPFPRNVAVIVTVCSDTNSQHLAYMPNQVKNIPGVVAFSTLALGIHFMVFAMDNLSPAFLDACCVSSQQRRIWMRDCAQKTLEAWGQFQGSRPVGKLAGK